MKCVIDRAMITDYLLKLDHPQGRSKAKVFIAGGFSPDRPDELGEAPRTHFNGNRASKIELDKLGCVRIVVTAPMPVADGREPIVTSVWIVNASGQWPRLVTAYPAAKTGRAGQCAEFGNCAAAPNRRPSVTSLTSKSQTPRIHSLSQDSKKPGFGTCRAA